ncbi:MAG: hypothetical protein PW788_14040 [Micavibrio sp.]|nr:hypothetical protein [Micavibrio sp.]
MDATSREQGTTSTIAGKAYIVQCAPETFEHATYLSAIFSEVLSFSEQNHRLRLSAMGDVLRSQFEKLGANVREETVFKPQKAASCQL